MNARLWLVLALGCQPTNEREDAPASARYFTGAEWVLDADGNVVRTAPVLVDRERRCLTEASSA